jgi:hypothetical protein
MERLKKAIENAKEVKEQSREEMSKVAVVVKKFGFESSKGNAAARNSLLLFPDKAMRSKIEKEVKKLGFKDISWPMGNEIWFE